MVEDKEAKNDKLTAATGPKFEEAFKAAREEKRCPHCQGANAPSASICRTCGKMI